VARWQSVISGACWKKKCEAENWIHAMHIAKQKTRKKTERSKQRTKNKKREKQRQRYNLQQQNNVVYLWLSHFY